MKTFNQYFVLNKQEYTSAGEYEPDTLSGFQRSIQRFLSDGKSHFNVLIDKKFETSRKVLAAKRKSLVQKAGKGNRPNTTRSLMKKTNFSKVANSVLPVLKSFREPCGGFCLSTLVLGPGMKAASCFGVTYNYNKILFKIAVKFLSVREIV